MLTPREHWGATNQLTTDFTEWKKSRSRKVEFAVSLPSLRILPAPNCALLVSVEVHTSVLCSSIPPRKICVIMAADSNKKSPKKRTPKEKSRDTVVGFSRFLYAMNLMLEKASAASRHELTRHETLLLSIFRNGIVSRKRVEEEFYKLLA